MSFVKRRRIVSIRVTEDEYHTLQAISQQHGANSVSEYLRRVIMNSEPFASEAKAGTREVTTEIDALKQKVDRLSQLVKQRLGRQRDQGAIQEDEGTHTGIAAVGRTGD